MRILVLGATGVAGRSTVPALVGAGHDVSGHARGDEKAALVRRLGAAPVTGDPQDGSTLRRWLHGKDAVVDLRVSIPTVNRAMLPWAWREYVRLRDTAAGQVVDAALRAEVPLAVHDTVTMGGHGCQADGLARGRGARSREGMTTPVSQAGVQRCLPTERIRRGPHRTETRCR